jgi:hypothetical protein
MVSVPACHQKNAGSHPLVVTNISFFRNSTCARFLTPPLFFTVSGCHFTTFTLSQLNDTVLLNRESATSTSNDKNNAVVSANPLPRCEKTMSEKKARHQLAASCQLL